jgi:hypothetical protein
MALTINKLLRLIYKTLINNKKSTIWLIKTNVIAFKYEIINPFRTSNYNNSFRFNNKIIRYL